MKRPEEQCEKYFLHAGKRICMFLAILTLAVSIVSVPVYALEDGAYTVSRTTSYANPETGQIVDGGSDEALGNSMVTGIVEDHVLVEQTDGKTYVTLGLGLASNVSNVRMQVQTSAGGGFQSVSLTQTGSCSRDGDTCNHYRFEVVDPSWLISPVMYVTPMGRDVQFFIRLNMGSAASGNGNFTSQMIPAEAAALTDSADNPADGNADEAADEETDEEEDEAREVIIVDMQGDLMKGVEGLHLHIVETEESEDDDASEAEEEHGEQKKSSTIPIVAGTGGVLAAAGGSGFLFWRKRKGDI